MDRHVRYLALCEKLLPQPYIAQDLNHLSLVNFLVSAQELLGVLNRTDTRRRWVWRHSLGYGFRGSLGAQVGNARYDPAQLPATYFALMTLLALDDELVIDADAVMRELCALQQDDGSFAANRSDVSERDVRFIYMAAAVRYLMHGKSQVDFNVDSAVQYLRKCRGYDGGYGQSPGAESHAGLTFCAVAALFLLGEEAGDADLVEWLVKRQNTDGGFNGRVGKESDVCYCFWTTSTLAIIGRADLANTAAVEAYLASCETKVGGYGKTVGQYPDLYHSYLGIATHFILKESVPLKCALSVSARTLDHLESLARS